MFFQKSSFSLVFALIFSIKIHVIFSYYNFFKRIELDKKKYNIATEVEFKKKVGFGPVYLKKAHQILKKAKNIVF